MFEVGHDWEDKRCDNHPVAWILIESTSSGILQNTSRVSTSTSSLKVEDCRSAYPS